MKRYIYWPNGLLTIVRDGRTVYDNGPRTKGEVLHGKPGPDDVVVRHARLVWRRNRVG
jgi:hypothetical protein